MTVFLLARHGETDWNREGRWQGHADRPLTGRGRAQAAALADRLANTNLEAIYASDLRRARETAEAIAARVGLEVVLERELREVDVGSWSGLTREEAAARYPEAFARWQRGAVGWENGESYAEMRARVLAAAERIAALHAAANVLLVTHAGPIRALHAAALGIPVETYRRLRPVEPNARLSAVCFEGGRVTELCSAPRLDELLAEDRSDRAQAPSHRATPAG